MRLSSRFSRPLLPSAFRLALGALLLLGFASAASAQFLIEPGPQLCLKQIQPVPSGVTSRPFDNFNSYEDYRWVHSSVNLQGQPAYEKFAAGLFWFPPFPTDLAYFQSAVVVNNPDPVNSTTITVEFYDMLGTLLAAPSYFLGPEATKVVPASPLLSGSSATPGLGVARVIGLNLPIVGETVHHADYVDLSAFGGGFLADGEAASLGLNSTQQLQMFQAGKTTLWFGPMPASTSATLDFLTGTSPMIWIANPNSSATTVTFRYSSLGGTVFAPVTVTIPAFGSWLERTLWNAAIPFFLSVPGPFDDDYRVVVTASQPIVGDALLVDLFDANLVPGGRFRMGSAMLANTPSAKLVNPELTYEVVDPGVETIVGIYNPTTANVGPVSVHYFDRNGASLGVDSFTTFPRGFMARIGPGLPASPNYPAAGVFAGWMRISACKPGLVGWTMRQGGEYASSNSPKKVWGEELTGANGLEPGPGFTVTVGSNTFVRKVSPLVRADPSWYWPGYTTWVNDGVANAGNYWFRFYDHPGVDRTNAAGQPFTGLRFGATSFTYDDPLVNGFGAINLSGRVDTTNGGFDGIHVIGDPLWEWGIFGEP
ncbi:MAG TPA: hypothetical protein VGS22_03315 [Thermoanaerobaculia bacterium]|jgi:hypothetical protein|nr:hypothetical protein [Thermoanaerobaculia bacterium]